MILHRNFDITSLWYPLGISHCTDSDLDLTPYFCVGQESESESVASNVNEPLHQSYDSFTLPDLDSDSDSKPNGYIALCRSFHTLHSQIPIPILTANYRNGIGVRVRT